MQKGPAIPLDDRPKCSVCGAVYPEIVEGATGCLACPGSTASESDVALWTSTGELASAGSCDRCGDILRREHWHRSHCWGCHPQVRVQRSTRCEVGEHKGQRKVYGDRVHRAVTWTAVKRIAVECWACEDCISRGKAQHYRDSEGGDDERASVSRATLRLFPVRAEEPRVRVWVGDDPGAMLSGVLYTQPRKVGDSWYLWIAVTRSLTFRVREDRLVGNGKRLEELPHKCSVVIYGYGDETVIERFASMAEVWKVYPELREKPWKGRVV